MPLRQLVHQSPHNSTSLADPGLKPSDEVLWGLMAFHAIYWAQRIEWVFSLRI
jgi:hypothetical protein